ncbi:MAG TPA: response regulator [Myxococcales bacterium]
MRLGIRSELFQTSLGLIAASVLAAGAYLATVLDAELSSRVQDDLLIRLSFVQRDSSAFDAGMDDRASWDRPADDLGRRGKGRVTIVRRDGVVLGDSEVELSDLARLESHSDRPETIDAFATGSGSSTRWSSTLKKRMANASLRGTLLLGPEVAGKSPLELIRNAVLKKILDDAAASTGPLSAEMEIGDLKPRRLLVHASLLAGGPRGVLAVFVDVTDLRRLETVPGSASPPSASSWEASLRGRPAALPATVHLVATRSSLALAILGGMARILLVEDEADLRRVLVFNLLGAGHRPIEAEGGLEGLRLARQHRPELVLLDLLLPDLSGQEVCRALKAHAATEAIPVVMLTARGEVEDRVRGLELGAEDYVVKPFSVREVLLRVAAVLRRKAGADLAASSELRCGPVRIDASERRVYVDDS